MKAKRLLFLVMAICLASGVKAQFYDSADDIFFYIDSEAIGMRRGSLPASVYVFNFDGHKACRWVTSTDGVVLDLKKNSNYYEDETENNEYTVNYVSSKPTKYEYNGITEQETYTFSSDRNIMYVDHKDKNIFGGPKIDYKMKYKRVDKSFFKVGRSRTPSGTLHE